MKTKEIDGIMTLGEIVISGNSHIVTNEANSYIRDGWQVKFPPVITNVAKTNVAKTSAFIVIVLYWEE